MKEMIDIKDLSRSVFCKVLIIIGLVVCSFSGWAQTTVTVGGGATVTCPATPTATWTTPPTGVTFSNWSRGSGVTCVSATNALSGSGFIQTSLANGYTANTYYSVTITADATHTFTLNSIAWATQLSGGTNSCSFGIRYSNDGGAITNFASATQNISSSGTATTLTFNASSTVTVAAGKSIIVYLIPFSATAGGTTVRWANGSTINVTAASACTTPSITGVTGTNPACASVVLTASGTNITGYSWSTGSPANTASNTFSSSGSYTLTVINGSAGCSATTSGSVTVNTASTAPTSITGGVTACANGTNTITLTQSGGTLGTSANYQWGAGTTIGTGTIVGAISASYTPTVTAGTNSYWVSVTNGSTCGTTGSGATVSFTGNSPSTAPTSITGGATSCANGSNTITLSQSGGTLGTSANYQWGTGTVVGTGTISGATSASYSPTVTAGSNSYWVSVANTSVCTNPATGATVTFTGNTSATSISPTTIQNISAGSNGATLTVTDGTSTPTGHQWYYSNTTGGPYTNLISGATSTTYAPNFGSTGTYFVVCSSSYGAPCNTTVTSNEVQVVVLSNSITTGSVSGSPFCQGVTGVSVPFTYSAASNFPAGAATFTAQLSDASGSFSSPTTLQSVTSDASGSQSISVTIPSGISAGAAYRIRVVSTSPAVTGNDNGTNLTVSAIPGTPACSTPAAVCAGTSATITGAGSSSATAYTYWTASTGGSSVTTGTTPAGTVSTNNLTTPTSLTGGTYTYYVQGENGSCYSASRQAVTVTVNDLPAIGTQPTAPTAVCSGTGTQTLSVAATGAGLSYSWRKGGTPVTNGGVVSGQGTNTLTLTAPTTSNAGSYDVVVSGTCTPSVTSSAVTVTVNSAPTISAAASSNTPICSGGTLNLSVTAAGTPTPTYAWSGTGSFSSTAVSNPSVTGAASGNYTVTATNTCGTVGSTAAVVVNTGAAITTNPSAQSVTTTGTATFTAAASGSSPTYQWQEFTTAWANITDGGVYSGSGTGTLTITSPTTTMNGYQYRCVASVPGCTSATSTAATLTVTSTVIWTNPINSATSITASPYTVGDVKDANLSSVSGISRGSGISASGSTTRYNANGWTTATSLDVNDYFEFTLTPASGYQINFLNFVYTGQVSSGTPSFSFRSSLDGYTSDIGAPTAGGTTISLAAYQSITSAITFRFYAYHLAAGTTTYSINDFTFNGAVVTACAAPTITATSPAATVCGPGTVTLGATASSGTVNWYTASTGGTAIATGSSYAPSISATTNYYVDATDAGCTTSSRALVVATLTAQPTTPACATPAAVCAGTSATITGAGSTGASAYTYWTASSGGSAVTTGTTPAGTVASNNLTTPTSLTGGTYTYYVQGENGTCLSAARQSVTVTVNNVPSTPSGTITAGANPACGSTTLTYSAPSASIYWETAPGNSATTSPTMSAYTLSSTGTIYVRAISSGCASSGTVNSGLVTINTNTSITTQPANTTVTTGSSATFTVVAAGTGLSYQWRKGGTPISGATSASYTIAATVSGDAGSYDVVVTGTCGTVTSSAATLTLTNFVYQAGDYRPTLDYTDLSYNNTASATDNWEYFDGTSWNTTPGDKGPQNATTTPTRVIITKYVYGGGNATHSYNNIIVITGGTLDLENNTTTPTVDFIKAGKSLEVQNGGNLFVYGQIQMNSTANLIVRNGGYMELGSNNVSNPHVMWNGVENFEPGSEVFVANWNYTGSGSGSLFNVSSSYPSGNISNNSNGYKFGILTVNVNPGASLSDWTLVGGSLTVKLCDTLNVSNAGSTYAVAMMSNTGSPTVTVGRINHYAGLFALSACFNGSATQTLNILENLTSNGSELDLFYANGGTAGSINVNLAGNLTVGSTYFYNYATSGTTTALNFNGTTTQYVDVSTIAAFAPMNVNSGAYVALKNHDLDVSSYTGITAVITVKTGGTFDFGFAADNITPLVIKKTISGGTNQFVTQQGSTLKITSENGIQQASATTGNVQFTTSNKTFNQLATFWYVGHSNQVTGDGLGTSSNGKQLIIDMASNGLSTTLTQNTGLTNDATLSATGGKLDIRKGQFLETTSGYISGSTGTLYMSPATLYQTPVLSATSSDVIPRMDGVSFAYNLTGGTIELSGAGAQTLRGNRTYYNVKYSGSNVLGTNYKNLSSDATIADTLFVTGSTTVVDCIDASSSAASFTGAGGIVMDAGRLRIKQLNTTSPQLTGVNVPYNFTGGTVEFYGSSSSTSQVLRGTDNSGNISYYNVDINAGAANTNSYNVSPSASFGIKGALTVYSPAVFQLDETENVSGVGNFEVTAAATLKYGSANGIKTSGTSTSDGNIRITGTRTLPTTASYGFVGNGAMVSGNGLPSSMVNMYIDKSGTSDVVTLTNTATATGSIVFTKGLVSTGSNELVSSNTSTTSITGYGATKYVIGNLRRYINASGSYDFPIGNSSNYDLGTVNFSSQTGITSLLGFFNTGQSGTSPSTTTCAINGSRMNDYLNNGFWTFTPDATMSGGSYDITLNAMGYTNAPSNANRMGVIKRSNASSPWLGCGLLGGSAQSSAYGTHTNSTQSISGGVATAVRSGVTGFSDFAIGLPQNNTPLPVKLLYLTATAVDNNYITLDWATASEINNSGFQIERSLDGVAFENIGWVDGKGNSNSAITYKSDDKHVVANTIYYYRLKQVDVDGQFEYSNIVSATLIGEKGFVMESLKPNPAANLVTVSVVTENTQSVDVSVVDMLGRQVLGQAWLLSPGLNGTQLDISALAQGVYHVTVRSANSYFTKTLAITR